MSVTKLPLWMIAAAAMAGGCAADDLLTDDEREALQAMVMDETTPIPQSRTNRFADNAAAAELGHAAFFDTRYLNAPTPPSTARPLNCRDCHDLPRGGADTKSLGPTTISGTAALSRNTPTVFNTAFLPTMNHWSGNFTAVWSVPSSVGSSPLKQAHFMYDDPYYRQTYEAVFGPMPDLSDTVRFPAAGGHTTPEWKAMAPEDQRAMGRFTTNIGKAIEAYERKLIDRNSPFDRFMNGDETALSPSAIRGAKLFVGRAACNECHNGPSFSDFKFHNLGIAQGTGVPKTDYGFITAGTFQSTYPFNANGEFSDDSDFGAAMVEGMQVIPTAELPVACADGDPMPGCGQFKTARLRSVALTAPYFHTGGVTNLWDVVKFYSEAAGTDGYVGRRDVRIRPLLLDDEEITDLVAFLTSLTGEPIADQWARCPQSIPSTACSAP